MQRAAAMDDVCRCWHPPSGWTTSRSKPRPTMPAGAGARAARRRIDDRAGTGFADCGKLGRWPDRGHRDHAALVSGRRRAPMAVGVGVGANYYRSRGSADADEEAALSARVQTEFIGSAPQGSYYALVQASSFRGGVYAGAQYSFQEQPFALEASYCPRDLVPRVQPGICASPCRSSAGSCVSARPTTIAPAPTSASPTTASERARAGCGGAAVLRRSPIIAARRAACAGDRRAHHGPPVPLQRPPRLRPRRRCSTAPRSRSRPASASALIGRNGAGKSSLLKILAGLEKPDDGLLQMHAGPAHRVYVPQEPLFDAGATASSTSSARAWPRRGRCAQRYEAHAPGDDLDALQTRIEALDAWTWEQRVDTTLQRAAPGRRARRRRACPAARRSASRWRRRWWPCPTCCCSTSPPTTSTSTRSTGCEELLRGFKRQRDADHPRPRLPRRAWPRASSSSTAACCAATRATSAPTSGRRTSELAAEALANARADKLLAQEEVWIRKGVEARRTRSVGAHRAAAAAARAARRRGATRWARCGWRSTPACPAARSSPSCATCRMRFGDERTDRQPLQRHHPARRQGRPDRPQRRRQDHAAQADPRRAAADARARCAGHAGSRWPTSTRCAAALDLDATLADTISPGSEWIEFNGQRKHVMSYLNDFLFSPERANSPVRTLSGGERNRAAAGAAVRAAGQRAGARRADQRPRHRHAGAAGGAAAGLRRHGVPGQPRPALPRQRGHQHHRLGGRRDAPGLWREYEGGYEDWQLQRARVAPAGARPGRAAAAGRGRRRAAARPRAGRRGAQAQLQGAARAATSCPRASRRWRPSRAPSASAWPAPRSTPTSRSAWPSCRRATRRSTTS